MKPEKILQSENIEKNSELVSSDTKTRSEEGELSFDSLADYDESGCPKVPFVFAGMTGKTLLHKQQSNLKLSANQNVMTQKKAKITVLMACKLSSIVVCRETWEHNVDLCQSCCPPA